MIRHVKTARLQQGDQTDPAVTDAVRSLLAEVAQGGDRAVRDLSIRFDGLDRDSYRLTDAEIAADPNLKTRTLTN